MRNFVFVTTELAPHSTGGAAVVTARLAGQLRAAGHDVDVVLAEDDRPVGDGPAIVEARATVDRDAPTRFLARSRAAAAEVARLVAEHSVDLIEFHDFEGLAFWALAHRTELGLDSVPLVVRVHGPFDLLADGMEVIPEDWGPVRVMEAEAYAMADEVIVPSRPIADLVAERYHLERSRIAVSEPPVPSELPHVPYSRRADPELVCFGRLGEVKGSVDFLEAGLELLSRRPGLRLRFMGADGWSAAAQRPMREWLEGMVPTGLADRVLFQGHLPRDELVEALRGVWALVIPSRFESFCLAAHEARAMGLPLVLADLPAFTPYFSEATGAVRYDGSVRGLVQTLDELLAQPERLDALAAAPAPALSDPLAFYVGTLPSVRHPRSQAGLATAAVARVEAAVPARRPPRGAALARGLLRHLPDSVGRLAVKVVPRGLKDRFRDLASWPAEQERRRNEARKVGLADAVSAGKYPLVAEPEITVVIPCFNQGPYLRDALASVFEQTFDSWEVVVVDDGSTDPETTEAIDALDLPRVRVIRQENRGLPGARNAGMRLARGRYLVPLDADDEIAPEYLATLYEVLEAEPGAAFAHCWAELYGDVEGIWVPRPFNPYQLLLSNSVVGCVLLRREAWESVSGYDETLTAGNEDWELWVRLTAAGWSQVMVPRPLFRYRQRGLSMKAGTEARFEESRTEIVARHRELYRIDHLRELKAQWYPWVSVIAVSAGGDLAKQDVDDLEVVSPGVPDRGLETLCRERGWPLRRAEDLAGAVAATRGKFVADWGRVEAARPGLLWDLATELETHPKAEAAGPEGRGSVLWRRWALVDPESPHQGTIEVDGAATVVGPATMRRGAFPDRRWLAPAPEGIPVHRQSAEEEGRLPAWLEETRGEPAGPGTAG